ncbi:MAG: GNAT family N-acetyltransferase [Cytophagaceae bacterium]
MIILENQILPSQHLFFKQEFLSKKSLPYTSFVTEEGQQIIFFEYQDAFISGYAATYGGFYPVTPKESLRKILPSIIETAKSKKLTKIIVKLPPTFLLSSSDELSDWESFSFNIINREVNQYISIGKHSLIDIVHEQERRKLKKQPDFVLELNSSKVNRSQRWDLLVAARKDKNYPVTITQEALEDLNNKLESHYTFIDCIKDDTLIAFAIAVQMSDEVFYYYLPATLPEYQYLSPSVYIINAIYELAKSKKCIYLDLGISSEKGILNEGLFQFKKNMGAKSSESITLQLSL